MPLSEDVDRISLHRPLPRLFHGYVAPFLLLYAAITAIWIAAFDFPERLEAFMIAFAVVAGLDVVTCLFCVWSVHVRAALTCRKVGFAFLQTFTMSVLFLLFAFLSRLA